MDLNGLSAIGSLGQAAQSQQTIAGNFDAFLNLLTTQLQNQNPLEPLDTNEFTAQLVQFSSVEQSIQANKNLEQLVALSLTTAFNNAVGYIGKTVGAAGSVTQLANGVATWNYSIPADSPETTITIRDAAGATVFTETKAIGAGDGAYTWDGRLENGTQAPDGAYSIEFAASDTEGNAVTVTTDIEGVVESIDMTGVEPVLTVNGSQINLSSVKTIKS